MFPKSLSFEPISTAQNYCVSGDVAIYAGVAIAPGVLLQADVGSRIVIRSGVCIGLGCVIHAHQGTITIHEGANLGAGVLLIGDVTIGARACLGAAVTVLNSAIDAGKIVESGLVIGDQSRRVGIEGSAETTTVDDLLGSIPMNEASPQASKPFVEPVITDTTGNPWQPCDPDPWDPSDHPPSETTCQVTSKPKEATPFDSTIYSAQNFSSPYPPYQNPPTPSTQPIATPEPIESDVSRVEMNSSVEPDVKPEAKPETKPEAKPETKPEETAIVPKDEAPKPVYGQAYVNQMLGRMLGR